MKKIKCPKCKKIMKEETILVSFPSNPHGHIGISAKALVCRDSKTELIPEDETDRILIKMKEIKKQKISKEARNIFILLFGNHQLQLMEENSESIQIHGE